MSKDVVDDLIHYFVPEGPAHWRFTVFPACWLQDPQWSTISVVRSQFLVHLMCVRAGWVSMCHIAKNMKLKILILYSVINNSFAITCLIYLGQWSTTHRILFRDSQQNWSGLVSLIFGRKQERGMDGRRITVFSRVCRRAVQYVTQSDQTTPMNNDALNTPKCTLEMDNVKDHFFHY